MFAGSIWASPETKPPPRGAPAAERGPRNASQQRKILVLEDDPIVSLAIENLLAEAGYVILASCARGEEAIELAARYEPDLVLADVKLAGEIDGIEAAAAIRADRAVPVIFVTAHTDPATRQRMQAAGAADILAKPVPDFLLVHAVAAALRH